MTQWFMDLWALWGSGLEYANTPVPPTASFWQHQVLLDGLNGAAPAFPVQSMGAAVSEVQIAGVTAGFAINLNGGFRVTLNVYSCSGALLS